MIEDTKVKAIGVHCRYIHERPREPAHWDILKQLASSVSIPIIANGDFYTSNDVLKFRDSFNNPRELTEMTSKRVRLDSGAELTELSSCESTSASENTNLINSFMFARGAQENVSLFREEGPLPAREVMQEYLLLAKKYQMRYSNAKYALLQMALPENERVSLKRRMITAKTMDEMEAVVFGEME
jgi:tRNA-dihydrouridine synthase 2